MNNRKFDLAKFERLETSNDSLKGGFSQALSATGGVSSAEFDLNLAKNCGQTNKSQCGQHNYVAGCGVKQ